MHQMHTIRHHFHLILQIIFQHVHLLPLRRIRLQVPQSILASSSYNLPRMLRESTIMMTQRSNNHLCQSHVLQLPNLMIIQQLYSLSISVLLRYLSYLGSILSFRVINNHSRVSSTTRKWSPSLCILRILEEITILRILRRTHNKTKITVSHLQSARNYPNYVLGLVSFFNKDSYSQRIFILLLLHRKRRIPEEEKNEIDTPFAANIFH